jgi:hypothetical protein
MKEIQKQIQGIKNSGNQVCIIHRGSKSPWCFCLGGGIIIKNL